MRNKRLWMIVLVLLLMVVPAVAFAQDGDGDKFVFGEDYVLPAGEVLHGNLAVVRGTATLEVDSTVKGDVAVMGGQLIVAGTVEGNVAVLGGSVSLADSAVVKGDLASFGGSVERAAGAQLQGETLGGPQLPGDTALPEVNTETPTGGVGRIIRQWILWQLGALGSGLLLALLGVVAVVLAPKAMGRMATAVATQPAMNFGVGLLTLAVGVLGGAVLLIACGLGLLVWLALLVALLVGWFAVGLWAGQRLLAAIRLRTVSSLVEVAVGVFGITVLGRLPWCIGFLFMVIVGSIGLGAVVLTRVGSQTLAGPRSAEPLPPAGGSELDAHSLALPDLLDQAPAAPDFAVSVPEDVDLPPESEVSVTPPDEPSAPVSAG